MLRGFDPPCNRYFFKFFCRLLTTVKSSRVVTLPVTSPVATSSFRIRRMIFPERVLGRAGVR